MFVARPGRKSDRTTPSDSGRLAVYALQGGRWNPVWMLSTPVSPSTETMWAIRVSAGKFLKSDRGKLSHSAQGKCSPGNHYQCVSESGRSLQCPCSLRSMRIHWRNRHQLVGPFCNRHHHPGARFPRSRPHHLPDFLFDNVVKSVGSPSLFKKCCILGYHGAFGFPVQTYSPVDFETSGIFGPATGDTAVMAHEVGGWMVRREPTLLQP